MPRTNKSISSDDDESLGGIVSRRSRRSKQRRRSSSTTRRRVNEESHDEQGSRRKDKSKLRLKRHEDDNDETKRRRRRTSSRQRERNHEKSEKRVHKKVPKQIRTKDLTSEQSESDDDELGGRSKSIKTSTRKDRRRKSNQGGDISPRRRSIESRKKRNQSHRDNLFQESDDDDYEDAYNHDNNVKEAFRHILALDLDGFTTNIGRALSQTILSCVDSKAVRNLSNAFNLGVGLRPLLNSAVEQSIDSGFGDEHAVVTIQVRSTDSLSEDPFIYHPVVRVSLVDGSTGSYMGKTDLDRNAVVPNESTMAIRVDNSAAVSGSVNIRRRQKECTIVPPQLTKPCNLGNTSVQIVSPVWDGEDTITFNVDFADILRPNVLVFFELMDFGANIPFDRIRDGNGFYRIAWAFLKPLSSRGTPNIPLGPASSGSKQHPTMRLQLYRYPRTKSWLRSAFNSREHHGRLGNSPDIFNVYRQLHRERYPSTIYVSVGGKVAETERKVFSRPTQPTELESHEFSLSELAQSEHQDGGENDVEDVNGKQTSIARRFRIAHEDCLVPTQLAARIPVGNQGCFTVEFSHDGKYLAAACVEDEHFPVKIFHVATGKLKCALYGHQSIVYEICWRRPKSETPWGLSMGVNTDLAAAKINRDTSYEIVSASSDGAALVWTIPFVRKRHMDGDEQQLGGDDVDDDDDDDLDEDESTSLLSQSKPTSRSNRSDPSTSRTQNSFNGKRHDNGPRLLFRLEHSPSTFVYTAQYHPLASSPCVIVTGTFDRKLRLWNGDTAECLGELDKGRNQHSSHINTCMFSPDGHRLVSGDASGLIQVWRLESSKLVANPDSWHLARVIEDKDLVGKPITSLRMHPSEKLMLVTAHQHTLRLFEMRRYTKVHQAFIGAPIKKSQIRACFSADGKYVVSGGEDGKPHFWNTITSLSVASYQWDLGYGKPLYDVAWHPTEHLVAFASFGGEFPILMYEASRSSASIQHETFDDPLAMQRAREEMERIEFRHKLHKEKADRVTAKLRTDIGSSLIGNDKENNGGNDTGSGTGPRLKELSTLFTDNRPVSPMQQKNRDVIDPSATYHPRRWSVDSNASATDAIRRLSIISTGSTISDAEASTSATSDQTSSRRPSFSSDNKSDDKSQTSNKKPGLPPPYRTSTLPGKAGARRGSMDAARELLSGSTPLSPKKKKRNSVTRNQEYSDEDDL